MMNSSTNYLQVLTAQQTLLTAQMSQISNSSQIQAAIELVSGFGRRLRRIKVTPLFITKRRRLRQIVRRPSSFPHASCPSKAYGRSHGTEMSAQRRRLSSCQQNSVFYHLPDRKKAGFPNPHFRIRHPFRKDSGLFLNTLICHSGGNLKQIKQN